MRCASALSPERAFDLSGTSDSTLSYMSYAIVAVFLVPLI